MSAERRTVLMNRERIGRTVRRMAWQIAETVRDLPIVLVGLDRAGSILATRTATVLENASYGHSIRCCEMDSNHPGLVPDLLAGDAVSRDSVLVLFSDVIFSGKTLYTTLHHLPLSNFSAVHVAVLVDRGHRTLPVAPRFTGMEIPTKSRERIEVVLEGGREEVSLLKAQTA